MNHFSQWVGDNDSIIYSLNITTLPKTNSSPLKISFPKRKVVFQSSIEKVLCWFQGGYTFGVSPSQKRWKVKVSSFDMDPLLKRNIRVITGE